MNVTIPYGRTALTLRVDESHTPEVLRAGEHEAAPCGARKDSPMLHPNAAQAEGFAACTPCSEAARALLLRQPTAEQEASAGWAAPAGAATSVGQETSEGENASALREQGAGRGAAQSDDDATAAGVALVERALAAPIGSAPLRALAKGKRRITILCSDHTRPVPSRCILPPVLRELRAASPEAEITLLIATGMHRPSTRAELLEKFGPELLARERIVIHRCRDEASLVELGALPSGAPLLVNRLAAEADLLLSEGFIEPHFFAGYSGGRKSVLPGVCGLRTILGNHCAQFIASPCARTGVLEQNPIHRDMLAAARKAKLAFLVNVVLDADKRVAAAVAGEPAAAHAAGVAFLEARCRVSPRRKGDIVVTSNGGAPLDQNLYQAVKGLTAAEAAAAPGAVLILCAACADGTGGEGFYRALRDCESPAALLAEIERRAQSETLPDQWEVQILARVLSHHRVLLVCSEAMRAQAAEMKLEPVPTLEQAFARAEAAMGKDAHVVVIPDGVSVVVKP